MAINLPFSIGRQRILRPGVLDRPQNAVFNRAHPMSAGILFYGVPSDGGIIRDYANPSRPIKSVSGTALSGRRGTGSVKTTFDNAYTTDLALTSGKYHIAAAVEIPGTLPVASSYLAGRLVYTDETHNTGWALQASTGTSNFSGSAFGNNGAANYRLTEGGGVYAINNYYVTAMMNDTALRYVRRDFNSLVTTSTNKSPNASTGDLVVGDPTDNLNILALAIWARVLSVTEELEFYFNPYMMLMPRDVPSLEYGQLTPPTTSFYSWQTR